MALHLTVLKGLTGLALALLDRGAAIDAVTYVLNELRLSHYCVVCA